MPAYGLLSETIIASASVSGKPVTGHWYIRQSRVQVGGSIHSKGPKSKAGLRVVYLDAETVAELKAHRARQAEERLAFGPGWNATGYVFVQSNGLPTTPECMSRTWRNLTRGASHSLGIPAIGLHEARHTSNTTAALYANVPQQVLIERVGHADVATNLRYQHTHEATHRAAADAIAEAYRAGRSASERGVADGP